MRARVCVRLYVCVCARAVQLHLSTHAMFAAGIPSNELHNLLTHVMLFQRLCMDLPHACTGKIYRITLPFLSALSHALPPLMHFLRHACPS